MLLALHRTLFRPGCQAARLLCQGGRRALSADSSKDEGDVVAHPHACTRHTNSRPLRQLRAAQMPTRTQRRWWTSSQAAPRCSR